MGRAFNGSSQIVAPAVGNLLDISNNNPMTVSAWFNVTNFSTEHDIVTKWGASGADANFILTVGITNWGSATGLSYCVGAAYNLTGCYGVVPGTLSANTWYNIVLAVDPAGKYAGSPAISCMVALAGVQIGYQEQGFRENRTAGGVNVSIGGQSATGGNFSGMVAEVGIWNDILSPGEIVALQGGIPPVQVRRTKLQGYWPLYGVSGTSIEPDLSGNLYTGTLTGTTPTNHSPTGRGTRY
jgi:Concanavalin A-like lectin/glucanases superfamily